MATADQIKSLIRFHFHNDSERFLTTALQLAAYEAHQGHISLAREIRTIIDKKQNINIKVIPFKKELSEFILVHHPTIKMSHIILNNNLKKKINRILEEYNQKDKLLKYGMQNRRKILLSGPPGTGKTMTASIISHELKMPLYSIQMDKIITKFMGETSAKLRQIFDVIKTQQGIFLFDEFDAIGSERGRDDDIGEMRRVLNSFLQFMENDTSKSIIIAATNNIQLLDKALFRRFDDILYYNLPKKTEATQLIKNRLASFLGKYKMSDILKNVKNLSHAEITQACYDAVKESILNNKNTVSKSLLSQMLKDKSMVYRRK